MEELYDDPAVAAMYRERAQNVRDAINSELYNGDTQLYRLAKLNNGTYREANPGQRWFPDAVAQTLPHLYGVVAASSPRAQAAMVALGDEDVSDPSGGSPMAGSRARMPNGNGGAGENEPDQSEGPTPMAAAVGYAALIAGDYDRAQAAAAAVKDLHGRTDWQLTVSDAGWLLRTLAPRAERQSMSIDEDVEAEIPLRGWHLEGDASAFNIVEEPAHGTIAIDGSVATYTPERDFNQSDRFLYAATYGLVTSRAEEVTINVQAVDDPPLLGELPDQFMTEDGERQTLVLDFGPGGGDDELSQVVTLEATTDNPGLIQELEINGNELTFTPAADGNGVALITVTASDRFDIAQPVTRSFSVAIAGVNDRPSLDEIDDISITEDGGTREFELNATAGGGADEALQSLIFTVASSNPELIPPPTVSGTRLSLTPVANASGTATITVTVDDGQDNDNAVTRAFVVDVAAANDEPLLTAVAAHSLSEGDVLSIELSASDIDGDALTYSADNLPAGAQLAGNALTWSPGFDDAGTYEVVVRVDDGKGGIASQTVTLDVADAIAPAVVSSLPSLDFGDVDEGSTSDRVFHLRNPGRFDVAIDELNLGGSYEIIDATLPVTVAAGDSVALKLRFTPRGRLTGELGDTLTVRSSAGVITVPLSGRGVWSELTTATDSLDFGPVRVGSAAALTLLLANPGTAALQLDSARVDNPLFSADAAAKLLSASTQGDEIEISFTPAQVGEQSGIVTIAGGGLSTQVVVSGIGVAPELAVSRSAHDFGEVVSDSSAKVSLAILNVGSDTLNIASLSELAAPFALGPLAATAVAPGDSTVVTLSFAASDFSQDSPGFSDSLRIATDAGDATVALSGRVQSLVPSDFNRDGRVDLADFFMLADVFYQPATGALTVYDQDASGTIDFQDLFLFADEFDGASPADDTETAGTARSSESTPAAAADPLAVPE